MNPDHICFDCKHTQVVENTEDDLVFRCAKGLIENWSIGFYQNVFQCNEWEYEKKGDNENATTVNTSNGRI